MAFAETRCQSGFNLDFRLLTLVKTRADESKVYNIHDNTIARTPPNLLSYETGFRNGQRRLNGVRNLHFTPQMAGDEKLPTLEKGDVTKKPAIGRKKTFEKSPMFQTNHNTSHRSMILVHAVT